MISKSHLQIGFCKRDTSWKISRPYVQPLESPEPVPTFSSGDEFSTPCPPKERQTKSKTKKKKL